MKTFTRRNTKRDPLKQGRPMSSAFFYTWLCVPRCFVVKPYDALTESFSFWFYFCFHYLVKNPNPKLASAVENRMSLIYMLSTSDIVSRRRSEVFLESEKYKVIGLNMICQRFSWFTGLVFFRDPLISCGKCLIATDGLLHYATSVLSQSPSLLVQFLCFVTFYL